MKQIDFVKKVKIGLNFGNGNITVGHLAINSGAIYFEYDNHFIAQNLEISPFNLPLKSGLHNFDRNLFEGLAGVFNDSLPDGWGRLLFDRFSRSCGILPDSTTVLDRLAYVGQHGIGALTYEPDHSLADKNKDILLDDLALQMQEFISGSSDDVLEELMALNGSSAGARPKAMIGIDNMRQHIIHGAHDLPTSYEPWIVKFANSQDGQDCGAIEYVYGLMAKECGIEMADIHLFDTQKNAGYFATKRFDRDGKKRYHIHSACGLLHSDFRVPSLDYEDLITLTAAITRDMREVEKIYRLAVFNVLSHNRDDHSKNFSFLMDKNGLWKLSPAYDLTFSSGPNGQQSTMVMGEGKNPGEQHLKKLGQQANISENKIAKIIDQTKSSLAKWSQLAKNYGVSARNIGLIASKIVN